MDLRDVERFLNWAFMLTPRAARARRVVFIFLGASLWAAYAYLYNPWPWDAATAQKFFFYPFRALFLSWAFPLILVLAIFFGLVLFLAPRYLPNTNPRVFRFLNFAVPGVFGFLWAFLAYGFTRPEWDTALSAHLLAYPFQALFAPHILRHVVVLGFAFWAAYRLAAYYLDDIYELRNLGIAEGFILQAAFGSGYNLIVIKDGDVAPEFRDSPIRRIGGPGLVRVHLENAAIFETFDGAARIIGPTGGRIGGVDTLAAFERLGEVIDLRDLIGDLSVAARTSDGILVKAEDVRIVFSVYRDQRPSTLEEPYPFDPESVLWMYYRKGREAAREAMRGAVTAELARFISQHTLSEFLAAISAEEEAQIRLRETQLRQQAAQEEGVNPPVTPTQPQPVPDFVYRPQMISNLFKAEFDGKARTSGVELKWIGPGTWVTPAEIVPRRHQEAWRLTLENLLRGSDAELGRVRMESQQAEFLRLVRETPIAIFRANAALARSDRMRRIIQAYHSYLNEVFQNPQLAGRLAPGDRTHLRDVLEYLSRFTGRWLGGGAAGGTTGFGGTPPGQPPPAPPVSPVGGAQLGPPPATPVPAGEPAGGAAPTGGATASTPDETLP